MATEQKSNPTPGNPDRAKMMRVLIPAVAVVSIVILVAVIVGLASGGRKMSDGSNGSENDPDLREVAAGVKVRDLKEGKGEPVPRDATVKAHYTGWLTNGTIFDSSKDRGQPLTFSLAGDVIKGWQEGIPGMKPGGIRKLVIAAEQAYGHRAKGRIPPGSTLIFEVELVEFVPPVDLTKLSDGTAPGADDPNLKELKPGVKYRDLKEGNGPPCPPSANVTMHYTGWLLNGTRFDSSRERGEPLSKPLAELIEGWQEGVPGMKPGGVRKLVISPEKGYKDKPAGKIPPNSTLVFEVELIKAD